MERPSHHLLRRIRYYASSPPIFAGRLVPSWSAFTPACCTECSLFSEVAAVAVLGLRSGRQCNVNFSSKTQVKSWVVVMIQSLILPLLYMSSRKLFTMCFISASYRCMFRRMWHHELLEIWKKKKENALRATGFKVLIFFWDQALALFGLRRQQVQQGPVKSIFGISGENHLCRTVFTVIQ